MSRKTINSGSAPILWSTVDEAFNRINDNFTELYLSVGGGGAVDLTAINGNINPGINETYDLGSPTKRWRDIYLSGSSIHLGDAVITSQYGAVNLPAGSTIGSLALDENYFKTIAVPGQTSIVADTGTDTLTIAASSGITLTTNPVTDTLTIANSGVLTNTGGTGITVNNSTGNVVITNTGVVAAVAGYGISVSSATGNVTIANTGIVSVITDPGSGISLDTSTPGTVRITNSAPSVPQNIFQTVAVSGQSNVVADSTSDILTFVNGTGVSITTNAGADSITFTNSGVTSFAVSGVGLSASAATGSITLSNTGVTAISAGDGISINQSTGTVIVTNTRFGFTSIAVGGQSSVLADNTTDTLVLIAGEGIQLTTNAVSDSITFDVTYLKGSVFSDASTMVINGATGTVIGPVATSSLRTAETKIALGSNAGQDTSLQSVAVGESAGSVNQGNRTVSIGSQAGQYRQGTYSVAIGPSSGFFEQGNSAVAIGDNAGQSSQGNYAIAVGHYAGHNNQSANSIILNASGAILNGAAAGFYVNPVRSTASSARPVVYDTTTKELFYTSTLEFINSTISTTDSSGLTVDVQTTFNTDVTFENDIIVTGQVTIGGELVVNGTGIAAALFTGAAATATTASTAASVGYLGVPQSATATTATLVIGDAGKHIYVNTAGQTITIPANSSVAYPIGTAISFVAGPSATTVLIAITSDTMYLAGTGTTGTRTLAAHGMATAIKVAATVWYINGTGLT